MLLRRTLVLGTVILMATASAAMAQRPQGQQRGQRPGQGGGFGGFGAGVTTLLAMPEVQKELSITDEQKGLIDDMLKDLQPQRGTGNRQDFQNLSDEERRKRFEEFQKQADERAKKAEETAKLILEPKQFERLGQLRIQREGVSALSRDDVAAKLGLSQDQKDKIAKIREASRGGGAGGFDRNASREEQQKAFAEARERREKSNAEILAVLTAEQKTTWEQMQGKKFEFPAPRRPGGGN
jgi:Spy/CpxP family protein refolding chaperone